MEKKKCELCEGVARIYCESDETSLCWKCDGKVHGANFLVAKHTRCLLCSVCHSPTSWNASGLCLGPTVSICQSCFARKNNSIAENQVCVFHGDRLRREDDGAESYNEDEGSYEEEEEAESQVVPLDAVAAAQQPLVVSSSSSVSICKEVFPGDGNSDLNCSDEESNDSRPLKRSRNLVKINDYDNLNPKITGRERIKRL